MFLVVKKIFKLSAIMQLVVLDTPLRGILNSVCLKSLKLLRTYYLIQERTFGGIGFRGWRGVLLVMEFIS